MSRSTEKLRSPLWVVIMAGGRGTRFWPLSRRARPKQVLALAGEDSLIRQTVDRLAGLTSPERILIVTGPDMVDAVRAELPELAAENILVEPSGRNTAPCIGWATVEVERRAGPRAVVAVLPSDHVIGRPDVLRTALSASWQAAAETGRIVTLGIEPTRPETGFGYLELGAEFGVFGGQKARRVRSFREKPDRVRAEAWLAQGGFLWNAGMFVFTVQSMREAFWQYLPRSADVLAALSTDPGALSSLWADLEATSIDYGVMERSSDILTIPCDPQWSDVGAWPAAAGLLPALEGGAGRALSTIAIDSQDNVVYAPDKLVALVGVQQMVVVDAGDALLVMDQSKAQDLRAVLAELQARGLDQYT